MNELMSRYGRQLDRERPLPEHPNPLFKRRDYMSLNGTWGFSITKDPSFPSEYGRITVPFSPETPLSGVGISVAKDDYLHYRRFFEVPEEQLGKRSILYFDAVDQVCDVYLNGEKIGHHEGGYEPFSFLLPPFQGKENVIQLVVTDDTSSDVFPRGKQSTSPGGIWYNPTSGIYQSVYLEFIPENHIKTIKITPLFDEKAVKIEADVESLGEAGEAEITFHGKPVDRKPLDKNGCAILDLRFDFRPWTPDTPNLYDLKISYGEDIVYSYCGMRKFERKEIDGKERFCLNGKPLFLSGVLDQGYYPDGGLTAPSIQAMADDLILVKRCGFNCVRKHIKLEPMTWYRLCDEYGIIVIQDFVNGGSPYSLWYSAIRPHVFKRISDPRCKKLGRGNPASRKAFVDAMPAFVNRLYNVPCIAIYTLFNESWGQFDVVQLTEKLRSLDPTRLIDSTSGWYDKKAGDFYSEHIYFVKSHMKYHKGRILSLSEFGGYSLPVTGHMYSMGKPFGYKMFHNEKELADAIAKLYEGEILEHIRKAGLNVAIYTQLSDVEDEINGLITYDREAIKVSPTSMKELNTELYLAFDNQFLEEKKR
jgi:beta-galactosidase/beta-glucuronidase